MGADGREEGSAEVTQPAKGHAQHRGSQEKHLQGGDKVLKAEFTEGRLICHEEASLPLEKLK